MMETDCDGLGRRREAILGRHRRLTDDDFSEIEERWVAGETLLALSKPFDCVPETLKRGLRKRGWQRPLNVFDKSKCELTDYQRGYADGFEAANTLGGQQSAEK